MVSNGSLSPTFSHFNLTFHSIGHISSFLQPPIFFLIHVKHFSSHLKKKFGLHHLHEFGKKKILFPLFFFLFFYLFMLIVLAFSSTSGSAPPLQPPWPPPPPPEPPTTSSSPAPSHWLCPIVDQTQPKIATST